MIIMIALWPYLVVLLVMMSTVDGFMSRTIVSRTNSKTTSATSTSLAGSTAQSLYNELTQQITQTLQLQTAMDYPAQGSLLQAQWLTEVSPQYLTGVSCYVDATSSSSPLFSINLWMGPSYDLPHMLLTFGDNSIMADYIPRGATPLGSDGQYLQAYYDDKSSWNQAHAGSVALPPPSSFARRLLQSPLHFAVQCDTNTVHTLAQQHVQKLLQWISMAQPIPARLRGSFNLRDDKLRQFYYQAMLAESNNDASMAAAKTGPIAEAYVGGGS